MKDGHGNPLSAEAEAKTENRDAAPQHAESSPRNEALLDQIARKHGVGLEAVRAALAALRRGHGTMAQFSHADFGGMAQWSKGGMSMVGDMFNSSLKSKLDGVLTDLAEAFRTGEIDDDDDLRSAGGQHSRGPDRWPSEYGAPSSSGSQNDMRYAFFPQARRLVIEDESGRKVYDTGEHAIVGVSQQQSADRTLTFESQSGPVRLDQLRIVE